MRKAMVEITMGQAKFNSEFDIADTTKEYEVADEAWKQALLFAETQTISTYGHRLPIYEFAEELKNLDYTYTIKEV